MASGRRSRETSCGLPRCVVALAAWRSGEGEAGISKIGCGTESICPRLLKQFHVRFFLGFIAIPVSANLNVVGSLSKETREQWQVHYAMPSLAMHPE